MSKPRAQSVSSVPSGSEHAHDKRDGGHNPPNEPLSGSKKVKNRNYSRHNNGEG